MPFEVGSSASFCSMIHSLNKTISIPDRKELLFILDSKRNEIVKSLLSFLSGKYFSVTTVHWTSLAVDNHAAFTIHFFDNFESKSYVLCCSKHDDESTAVKLERQLFNALAEWGSNTKYFVSLVSDSASNMNSLHERVMNNTSICHHYYADIILQLSAVKAFSGSPETLAAIKKLKSLVSYVNKSPLTASKLHKCQKMILPTGRALKLLADLKTRWWSTPTMVERCLKLRPTLEMLFREEIVNRSTPDKPTI
jgi:hypothetical protein